MLDSLWFIQHYTEIVEEFDHITHPDTYPAIRRLYCVDPHDLVSPFALFVDRDHVRGFVATLLMNTVAEMKTEFTHHG